MEAAKIEAMRKVDAFESAMEKKFVAQHGMTPDEYVAAQPRIDIEAIRQRVEELIPDELLAEADRQIRLEKIRARKVAEELALANNKTMGPSDYRQLPLSELWAALEEEFPGTLGIPFSCNEFQHNLSSLVGW